MLFCTLCACDSTSAPLSSPGETRNSGISTGVDASNPFFFVDDTTTKGDIVALYGTGEYGDCYYEEFELFDSTGRLEFEFREDSFEGIVEGIYFTFYYPGSRNWHRQGPYDTYSPTVEDKHAAQEFLNNVVSQFTEAYGTPYYAELGMYIWDLSDDFIVRQYGVRAVSETCDEEAVIIFYGTE